MTELALPTPECFKPLVRPLATKLPSVAVVQALRLHGGGALPAQSLLQGCLHP